MPTITAVDDQTFEAPEGKKLVLAIEDAGIDILHRCGGNARCTTCRVEIIGGDPGPVGELEQRRVAREKEWPAAFRLSCQIRCHDDLTLRVINHLHKTDLSDPGPRPVD